jgi:hypothetical protein
MLEKYLRQLVTDFKLDPVAPLDENKMFSVKVSNFQVFLKYLDPGIYFYAKITQFLPQHKKEDMLGLLMKANFLGQGTGGSTIGITEDESFLTLSLCLPYDMNYKEFKEALEDFVNFLDYWEVKLTSKQG